MRASRRGNSGVALLTTLLVLVLIVSLAVEIFRVGARAAQTGAYGRDSIRAELLADGGVAAAKAALADDARKTQIDTLGELWALAWPPQELGEGTITVTVEDEERKINLNKLVLPNRIGVDEKRAAVFRRLLTILGLEPTLADSVIAWIDVDDVSKTGGAGSSYYLSLPFPYRAKNDFFDTIDELRLVRGITPEVFAKLKPFITVRSSGKVNINTAPREVLMSLSAAQAKGDIDEAAANQIIEYRKEQSFEKASDIEKVSPALREIYRGDAQFQQMLDVKGTAFHVRSTGIAGGTARTIDAMGERTGNVIQWHGWRLE